MEYLGGDHIYWTGYANGAYGATMEALKAVRYNAKVHWIAENPKITFDIEGDDWGDE